MKFTVAWTKRALNELIQIWQDSANRALVTAAVQAIDRDLARNPETSGESGEPGFRRLVEAPLFVLFHVRPADRIATVVRVKQLRTRS